MIALDLWWLRTAAGVSAWHVYMRMVAISGVDSKAAQDWERLFPWIVRRMEVDGIPPSLRPWPPAGFVLGTCGLRVDRQALEQHLMLGARLQGRAEA